MRSAKQTVLLSILAVSAAVIAVRAADAHVSTAPTYTGTTSAIAGVTIFRHPQYDAKGVPLGGFRLFPSLDITANYDDNVFRKTLALSDWYFEEASRLSLQSQWGRHFLELFGGVDNYNYLSAHHLNVTDWTIGGDGRLDISRAADATAAGFYGEFHEPLESPNTAPSQASPNRFDRGRAEIIAAYGPGRLGVDIGGVFDRLDWLNSPLTDGGEIVNTDRDESEYMAFAKTFYNFSPGYAGYVTGHYESRQFDLFFDRLGMHRSSTGYRIDGGVDLQLSHLVSGEVQAGYFEQHFAQNVPIPLPNVSGVDYAVGLDWYASPILTLHLNRSREFNDVIVAGASISDDVAIKLSAEYEFRRNVVLRAFGSYTTSRLVGTVRKDHYPGAGVSVRYLANRYVVMSASYGYMARSSTVAGLDFTDNTVNVGLSVHV